MRHKKIVCLALTALMLVSCFGCSSEADPGEPSVDPEAMVRAMMEVDTTLPEMVTRSSTEDEAKDNFFYLSDLDYSKVESYFYAYANAGTAEEMAVVKLKNKSDTAAMLESLHKHVESRQGTFEEYDPEQVPLTEGAVITNEGRYVVLIVSKKSGLVQNEFKTFFQTN